MTKVYIPKNVNIGNKNGFNERARLAELKRSSLAKNYDLVDAAFCVGALLGTAVIMAYTFTGGC